MKETRRELHTRLNSYFSEAEKKKLRRELKIFAGVMLFITLGLPIILACVFSP